MFDKSYFETLQDYLASGCTMELTDEELDYYNVLYALEALTVNMARIMPWLF